MLVAFELKKSLKEIYQQMDLEELGWWLAFIKYKAKLEEAAVKKRNRPRQIG